MKKTYLLTISAVALVAMVGCTQESHAVQTSAKENISVGETPKQSFSEKMREAHDLLKNKPMADQVQAF